MVNLRAIKTQLIIFLCGFAIYLSIRDKDTLFLLTAFIAVISAMGIESAILYFGVGKYKTFLMVRLRSPLVLSEVEGLTTETSQGRVLSSPTKLANEVSCRNKKLKITDSSIISGLLIGYVLSSNNPWWMFLCASTTAICSKYLLRINKRHLFNPAALGIFLAIILFDASTQWKGTFLWYLLVPFGLYFIVKIKKLELLLGYALTSLSLFGIQAIMQKTPILNIFGYLSYFYIFIMLIEPKTTPIKPLGKLIFGMGVAVLIFIFTEMGVGFDAELGALLIFNLATPLLNRLSDFRKET